MGKKSTPKRKPKQRHSATGRSGLGSSRPSDLTSVNGVLYFVAGDGVHGREIWRSDGTADGTVMVKNIGAGAASSVPSHLTPFRDLLFFTAYEYEYGQELWKSDGTAAGGNVTLTVSSEDGDESVGPAQWSVSDGQVAFSFTIADEESQGLMSFNGRIAADGTEAVVSGSWTLVGVEDLALGGDFSVTRPLEP